MHDVMLEIAIAESPQEVVVGKGLNISIYAAQIDMHTLTLMEKTCFVIGY